MGAWGTGPFENDDASDWLAALDDAVPQTLRLTFEPVTAIEPELYLEAPDASEAVAAAEVLVAMRGKPGPSVSNSDVMAWARTHRDWADEPLVRMAREAVNRVREASELRDLWSETEEFDSWLASLDDLLRRLG